VRFAPPMPVEAGGSVLRAPAFIRPIELGGFSCAWFLADRTESRWSSEQKFPGITKENAGESPWLSRL